MRERRAVTREAGDCVEPLIALLCDKLRSAHFIPTIQGDLFDIYAYPMQMLDLVGSCVFKDTAKVLSESALAQEL